MKPESAGPTLQRVSSHPVQQVAALPGVAEAVEEARSACAALRWNPALRRREAQVRAEASIEAAHASAALDGAVLPAELVRDFARGSADLPDDPTGRTVLAALRVIAEADRLSASAQLDPPVAAPGVLARLHVAAAAGMVPPEQLGRPRSGDDVTSRLEGVGLLLQAPASAPAAVVAALVHAELATARPFPGGAGLLARGLARAVAVRRGLDPTGIAVWETGLLAAGETGGLAGYAAGDVAGWVRLWCAAVVAAARDPASLRRR